MAVDWGAARSGTFWEQAMAHSDNILTKMQDLACLIPQLNKFPRDQKCMLVTACFSRTTAVCGGWPWRF